MVSGVGRWFTRWFYVFVLVCCIFTLVILVANLFASDDDVPLAGYVIISAFAVLVVLFAARLQYGIRWMFRHRHDRRRQC